MTDGQVADNCRTMDKTDRADDPTRTLKADAKPSYKEGDKMFFVISYSEAIDLIVENLMAWHWDPDSSAFAACGSLENKTDEELEDILHAHIRIEEQMNGFEDGLLSCVRFKIVRDHDLIKLRKSVSR